MVEPEKPFACSIPNCGMTFTNEDHLTVHTKKHDMYLQFGYEQKAAFVADQTPTPTRFIRNCEEVGLFQDLQNVNPFEEGFKRAMETCKHGLLSLENSIPSTNTDDLHTPQMVFPILDNADPTLYANNSHQKNITISRSSSDESGTIKEYETTTISKLTNAVKTISRVINKHDILEKSHTNDGTGKTDEHITHTDVHKETSVSYTNNVIKIHNNIEIRKDNLVNIDSVRTIPINIISYDPVTSDENIITQDVLLANNSKSEGESKLPPIMSQRSIDLVVDSLTSDVCVNNSGIPEVNVLTTEAIKPLPSQITPPISIEDNDDNNVNDVKSKDVDDYEVIIKLPNGKRVRMKAVEETAAEKKVENNTKEKLKQAINKKVLQKKSMLHSLPTITTPVQTILPIQTGTLIPITLVHPTTQLIPKIPIEPFDPKLITSQEFKKTVKRKYVHKNTNDKGTIGNDENKASRPSEGNKDDTEDCCIIEENVTPKKRTKEDLSCRVQASRRYRIKLKESMQKQVNEIKQLREENLKLASEKAVLKLLITEHMKTCPNTEEFRISQETLKLSGIDFLGHSI